MSIKKNRFTLLSIATLASFSLAACGEPLPEIPFNDTITLQKEEKEYQVALGKRTLYCLVGNYKGLKGGEALVLQEEVKFRYSVAALLRSYPQLMTKRNLIFARKQQVEFKKRNSPLYDPTMDIELSENSRPNNPKAREQ